MTDASPDVRPKSKQLSVDLNAVRIFAIFWIVAVHALFVPYVGYASLYHRYFSSAALYVFFLFSGFALSLTPPPRTWPKYRDYVLGSVLPILRLYVLYFVLFNAIIIAGHCLILKDNEVSLDPALLKQISIDFLLGTVTTAWYFHTITIFMLLLPLWVKMRESRAAWLFLAACVAASIICPHSVPTNIRLMGFRLVPFFLGFKYGPRVARSYLRQMWLFGALFAVFLLVTANVPTPRYIQSLSHYLSTMAAALFYIPLVGHLAGKKRSWRAFWQKLAPSNMDIFIFHRLLTHVVPMSVIYPRLPSQLHGFWMVVVYTLFLFAGAFWLGKAIRLSPMLAWFALGIRRLPKRPSAEPQQVPLSR